MSIQDKKISESQIITSGVSAAPDRLTGTAAENKALFDRLIKQAVAPALNAVVEELVSEEGANNIGTVVDGLSGTNVGDVLAELKALSDKSIAEVQLSGTNLIATLKDGTKTTISLEKFSDNYAFNDSGQIDFTVTDSADSHAVTAAVKSGSITLGHLAVDAVHELNEAVQKAELAAEKAQAVAGGDFVAAPELAAHTNDKANPHGVTAAQLGAAAAEELAFHINAQNNPHSVTASQIGAPPESHSSSSTTYGIGNSNVYGHVKISDKYDANVTATSGIAASPAAVKAAYDLANSKAPMWTYGTEDIEAGSESPYATGHLHLVYEE